MFCIIGDDGIFVVGGVVLVSIVDEIVRVFPTGAEQTCGNDKMRHFLRGEACFQTQSFCCDRQPLNLESAAPGSHVKSLRATVNEERPQRLRSCESLQRLQAWMLVLHWARVWRDLWNYDTKNLHEGTWDELASKDDRHFRAVGTLVFPTSETLKTGQLRVRSGSTSTHFTTDEPNRRAEHIYVIEAHSVLLPAVHILGARKNSRRIHLKRHQQKMEEATLRRYVRARKV